MPGVAHHRIVDSSGGTPFEDDADHGRILIPGVATNNAYSLMELTVAPRAVDSGFGAHTHNDIDEVFVLRQGTIDFLLDDDLMTITPGDVVRVPAGTRHGYRNTSDEPAEMLVWFSPGGFEELFVTYRTDQPSPDSQGFVAEAITKFNSSFEP